MSAVEAAFGENSSRIPTVKAEVLYEFEYDSKHRAVNISAPSHEEIGVYSTPTDHPDYAWQHTPNIHGVLL